MSANPSALHPSVVARPPRLVITGASSGLGREIAISYAAPGVELLLIGRNAARLTETAESCRVQGAKAVDLRADVTDAAALTAALNEFLAAGEVDLLVANAGVLAGPQRPDALDGPEAAALQIQTNLLGVIQAVETVAPSMIRRRAGQIAVVASTAAYRGLPYMPAYSASKAGVRAYGEAVRARLAPFGVRVSVVAPSFFDSPMTERFAGPMPLKISLAAATKRVRRGLDRGAARIVFPRRIAMLMQLLDLLPASWGDSLLRADVTILPERRRKVPE